MYMAQGNSPCSYFLTYTVKIHRITTLRSLLDERSILSEQGSIFLENQLSEQAELSKQGGIFQEHS